MTGELSMTQRLGVRLERPTHADVGELHQIYSDPRVWTHYPSARFVSERQTERLIDLWIAGWEAESLSAWLVRDEYTGDLLGHVGCSLRGAAFWNLGYRLAVGAHGRGIATAVATYAVEQAQLVRPEIPVAAYLLEHNLASARVAQKAGLSLRYRGPDAGNPDPEAVRLVFADRDLDADQLRAVLA